MPKSWNPRSMTSLMPPQCGMQWTSLPPEKLGLLFMLVRLYAPVRQVEPSNSDINVHLRHHQWLPWWQHFRAKSRSLVSLVCATTGSIKIPTCMCHVSNWDCMHVIQVGSFGWPPQRQVKDSSKFLHACVLFQIKTIMCVIQVGSFGWPPQPQVKASS